MRTILPALVFGALSASVALAQTTVTGQPSTGGTNSTPSPGQGAVTRPNTDQMQGGQPTSPAAVPGATGSVGNAQLEAGANSFTEGQVRSRLEQAGFMNVTELRKDDQGIWRGKAMQNGRSVTVGFDFKGNVAAQ
jgi:periplasmic protein CpxP/Spy